MKTYKDKEKYFLPNGGDLISKNPPNALILCMHLKETGSIAC